MFEKVAGMFSVLPEFTDAQMRSARCDLWKVRVSSQGGGVLACICIFLFPTFMSFQTTKLSENFDRSAKKMPDM